MSDGVALHVKVQRPPLNPTCTWFYILTFFRKLALKKKNMNNIYTTSNYPQFCTFTFSVLVNWGQFYETWIAVHAKVQRPPLNTTCTWLRILTLFSESFFLTLTIIPPYSIILNFAPSLLAHCNALVDWG